MKSEAKVVFDVPFRYSRQGQFETATEIKLVAPGLGKRHVHTALQAFVGEAVGSLQERRASLLAQAGATESRDAEAAAATGNDDTNPLGYWMFMTMGLNDKSLQRLNAYLMAELTGSPRLASIGDTGEPMTDAAWESLVETNGMEAVDRVLGTYIGFFMGSPKSKKETGSDTSTTSSSPPKVASRVSMRQASRSQS